MTLRATDRDESTDPGVDFYRFANGGWLDANDIPPGYGAWGAFNEVDQRNEAILHELLLDASTEPSDDLDRMLGDYFAAGMDREAVEADGLSALRPLLDLVAEVRSADDVLAVLPPLHRAGVPALFGWGVEVDHDDSSRHLLWLVQGGLGLPDRDSYTDESESAVALREAYVRHLGRQLENAGVHGEPAADVLALETALALEHLRSEERRDMQRILNRHSRAELAALAPDLDLNAYLDRLGATSAAEANVENPGYVAAIGGILRGADPATLRAYLAFHVVRAYAGSLPAAVDDESFDFYGRLIEGKTEQKERFRRVLGALGADAGEALGRRYVDVAFPPSAKDRAVVMVERIIDQMRDSLRTRDWMSESTRAQGLAKLDTLRIKIGYPDAWRDWSGLTFVRSSYATNRLRAAEFEAQRQLRRIDEPVDVTEWAMPPHVVNAYYHPLRNEIVFPAGILQPPMFDADADDAVNYGAIGAVIAHEITHGFDDQGRQFDENGAFRSWWTDEDAQRFTERAEGLVRQFDGYLAVDDVPVNGRLTLGENIADLGGVTLAFRALAPAPDAPEIDGLTPAQRFFVSYASVWRGRTSDELARTLARVDPHSPARLRVLGPLSNLDAFRVAFGLADDVPMMRARDERIEIW